MREGRAGGLCNAPGAALLVAARWPRPETEWAPWAGLEPSQYNQPQPFDTRGSYDGLWSILVSYIVMIQEFCSAAGGEGEQNHHTALHAHA